MKALLAGAAVVLTLVLAGDAFAQSCTGACRSANSQCQKSAGQAGAACLRGCGGRASCMATCQKQERAVTGPCGRQYQVCVRACRGR
jgi:hypothetical protein